MKIKEKISKEGSDPDPFIPGSFTDDRSYLLVMPVANSHDCPHTGRTTATSRGPSPPKSQSSIPATIQEELYGSEELYSNSSSLTTSAVKVEISDIGEGSLNLTTSALRKCKQLVLRPYWMLLMFIGWRGFGRESINSGGRRWKVLNMVYPVLIILLLLYTYIYEMVACEWKLDVKKDTQSTKTTTVTIRPTPPSNETNTTTQYIPLYPLDPAETVEANLTQTHSPPLACEHVITTYVIPNFLHFIAYIMGFIYFRIHDNEHLYALMEKVFLQATPLQSRTASQKKMIRKLRCFLACGTIWVLLTLCLQGLYVWAFNFPGLAIFQQIGRECHWILFVFELVGRMVLNAVNLAVVVNYATQCEMILFFVRGLTLRLQEKSTDLRTAMKDVLMLRQTLSMLNGSISKMTSLTSVILGELTIIGISILALNKYNTVKVWTYRSIFPVIWALMLSFPLFQAARVNSVCRRIKKISLEMRVFGYKNNSQLDLDSFLLFVGHTNLKAKLFHIPIQPSYVISILVLGAFVLLILFQTSSIGPVDYIF
ncbi:uncharacterized protein [Haliotis cracherodii]|uniref:uncharacterized protein isoform X1 n=1 Tax=Haliotis cracherodii TaxID=6455 RepID=UPI0039E8FFE5